MEMESKGGAVVRALASRQCGPGPNPGEEKRMFSQARLENERR